MSTQDLLTPDSLANMLALSRKTVVDHFIKQPGFPNSVTGPRKLRWLESEVRRFLKQKSEQKAITGYK